ncbi:hypothetical protein KSS87_011102 [Heliosperma pusillum]|nr:hypothetical protein KSS87_011102 [Heliosperma pusillum]
MDDKLRPPSPLPGELLPWIVYTHGDAKSKKVQTFSTSPFNNKSYLKSVPEMRGKSIKAHLDWLLLRDQRLEDPDKYSFTLWNPFTLKSIQLPTLNFHYEGHANMKFALTSSPSPCDDDISNNCFAFLFFEGWAFCCQFHPKGRDVPGCSSWVSERFEVDGVATSMLTVVTLNGILYGCACIIDSVNNSRIDRLVCIKPADDGSNSFTIKFLPLISMPRAPLMLEQCYTFMVESCGSIYIVLAGTSHDDDIHGVQVFELDLHKGTWGEVKCLGDRAFLLVQGGCSWWPASTGTVKGNCVYILQYEYVHDAVLCCSLTDCSFTILPCPKLLNPRSYRPVWVTPQHNRVLARRQCEKYIEKIDDDDVVKSCEAEAEVVRTTECKSLLQHDKKQENRMYKLPLHIIELISKYMHLFDYWNFRCTCKTIQSATLIPQWKKNNVLPLLMVFEDEGGLCRIIDPCRDDSHSCTLHGQDFFDIKFSKNGWLLIYDGISIQVCNPFTREKRCTPRPTRRFDNIGFSSDPTCSSCLTVAISYCDDGIIINYLRFEDKEWNSCHFGNNQGIEFYPSYAGPMYYAGGFYILNEYTGNLGVFELGDGDPRWTVYDRPYVRAGGFHSSYLVECGGDLISVFIGKNGSWVQLFRFNYLNKKWVRIKDLGSHILFISHTSCFSEAIKVNRMRNRIYLPWLKGNNIVYYSLETEKYHVDGSDDEYKDFFFMKQPFRCCWI